MIELGSMQERQYLRCDSEQDQVNTLFRLGYYISESYPDFSDATRKRIFGESNQSFKQAATADFQRFHGLKDDGYFGPVTAAAVSNRFCAVPDILPAGGLRRWDNAKWPLKIYVDKHADWFSQAADEIASHGKRVEFGTTNASQQADIYAHFRRIDGPNRTLAWSYLPSVDETGRLEQRYDTGEDWTSGNREDTFLRPVMVHELLHAMGLGHHSDQRSIMFPSMNGVQHMWGWEIDEIHRRYGKQHGGGGGDKPTNVEIVDGDIVLRVNGVLHRFALKEDSF